MLSLSSDELISYILIVSSATMITSVLSIFKINGTLYEWSWFYPPPSVFMPLQFIFIIFIIAFLFIINCMLAIFFIKKSLEFFNEIYNYISNIRG